MHVLSDNYDFATELLPPEIAGRLTPGSASDPLLPRLIREFLGLGGTSCTASEPGSLWKYLVLSRFSPRSQFDRMIELARSEGDLPDRLVCVAGSGEGFHGFKGRPWTAAAGNLHVTIHITPGRPVERAETAFTLLATLSVVDAIDSVPGLRGRARIKWINDVLIDDAKVAGALAYTLTQEAVVTSAVLGIGLNVETAPVVPRSPAVPRVGSVRDFAPDEPLAGQRALLASLLAALDRNYGILFDEGYEPLRARYESRSDIVGSRVAVYAEGPGSEQSTIAEGRVVALGEGLELYFENRDEPVTRGRLVRLDPGPAGDPRSS